MATYAQPQPARPPSRMDRRVIVQRVLGVVGMIVLIIFALLETLPFVLTVANSFKCLPAVQQQPQAFIPRTLTPTSCRTATGAQLPAGATTDAATFAPTTEGYQEAFQFAFGTWFTNTIIYTTFVTILRLLFDSLAGYALARMKFPGNRPVFFLVLGTLMIPGVVLLIPRFIILKQLGMLNTYQGVILSLAADAFGVFLMKQFFESIPEEIEEAAKVDGANRLVMFFRVVLPMATPALTALAIFSFTGTWNNFMDVLIIIGGDPSKYNLPLGLAMLRGQSGDTLRWHLFLAASVMTTVPLAIVFFVFQRYFVEGISYSGLKG